MLAADAVTIDKMDIPMFTMPANGVTATLVSGAGNNYFNMPNLPASFSGNCEVTVNAQIIEVGANSSGNAQLHVARQMGGVISADTATPAYFTKAFGVA